MSMTQNISIPTHSAQGVFAGGSERERQANVILGRMRGEVWSHRYRPQALGTWAWILAVMAAPLNRHLAQIASLLGVPEQSLRYYVGGWRPMPAPLFVDLFTLPQRDPSESTDLALGELAALKGQTVVALPEGDPAEIRRALKDAMDQFTAFAGTVLMALEDDTIVPHEVTDIALWYRRHQDGSSRLMACVIAAEKAAR